MIERKIKKPKNLSDDSILHILEVHFAGKYKTTRSNSTRLSIRKLYKYFVGHSREVAHKKMSFKDSGYFMIHDNYILFKMTLGKQLLFWIIIMIFGILITWKVWNASFLLSVLLIASPIMIIWLFGILELIDFIDYESTNISSRLSNSNDS